MGMLSKYNATIITPQKEIIKFLRNKYGESLSRKYIDMIDLSLLGEADKEAVRKLKISFANKGRKPWNVGRQHRPDTVQRIKEKTRLAMCRSEVRKRWEAGWKPKSHSQETKEKLRTIMKQRQGEKTILMAKWLNKEMGIDLNDFSCLPPRFRTVYKRAFNLKWRIHKTKSSEEEEKLVKLLHEVNVDILKIYTHEVKRQKFTENRSRKRSNHSNNLSSVKRQTSVVVENKQYMKSKHQTEKEKKP